MPIAALTSFPTERVRALARHKTYLPTSLKYREDTDWQSWVPNIEVLNQFVPTSTRLTNLAEPKQPNSLYVEPRSCRWPVSREAMNCVASERVHKLAKPKNRHPESEDYDPNTWTVSRSALLARASPRIEELATPIPRKVRTKKT